MIVINITKHHHYSHQFPSAVLERAEQYHWTWGGCPRRHGRPGTGEKITMIMIEIDAYINMNLPVFEEGEGLREVSTSSTYHNADGVDVQGGDEGSLKTGNAGGRVGCGVVARAN